MSAEPVPGTTLTAEQWQDNRDYANAYPAAGKYPIYPRYTPPGNDLAHVSAVGWLSIVLWRWPVMLAAVAIGAWLMVEIMTVIWRLQTGWVIVWN